MRIYAAEFGFISRLLADRKELFAYARTLGSADAMRAARLDLMASTRILLTPKSAEEAAKSYTIDAEGAAHIPIVGELTPAAQTDACGAYTAQALTEYGFIIEAAKAADMDPAVKSIAFDIDSPGGYVSGVDEAAQVIAGLAKPTLARVGDMAVSAAYWLASQADKIEALSPISRVGSIGVAAEEYDEDEKLSREGVAHRVYTSTDAPDKQPDTATAEGRDKIVSELNELHSVFVSRVASGRGVTAEKVREEFGHGGLVIASKAFASGMIDSIKGVDISRRNRDNLEGSKPAVGGMAANSAKIEKKEVHMDLVTLKAESPETYKAAFDEGVKAERTRREQLMAFVGINAEGDKAVNEAIANGKEYAEVAPILAAATARGAAKPDQGENAPALDGAKPVSASGASGNSENETAVFKGLGITAEDVKKYGGR